MSETAQTESLASLLHLARRAREARDLAELRFILANETHILTHYRQAALWMQGSVAALSGVVTPEANAPYTLWLSHVFRQLQGNPPGAGSAPVEPSTLPEPLRVEWNEWLPAHALWLPVNANPSEGALLLARDDPWSEAEIALLAEWMALWSQSLALITHRRGLFLRPRWRSGRQAFTWVLIAAAVSAMLIPVPLTVLAPAELVPLSPAIIRAPLDGVVSRMLVQPNQQVRHGDTLFEFDRAGIQNKLEVAKSALGTLQAEYRQKAQQSLLDPASKAQLAPLQGQIAEKNTEIHYLRQLNERGLAVSPRDGIALLDDPMKWIGRPVATGEKIMMVADPREVEIEAWLTPADAIHLPDGSPVKLFLNADPLKPVAARLRYVGHEAVERPDGSYAYRVRASLADPKNTPRLGLKGFARISGESVSFGYWIVRRPLAALRGWLGV